MSQRKSLFDAAAYGGDGWSPRTASLAEEAGSVWGRFGIASEWQPLKAVLMHRPGPELVTADANAAQQLAPLDLAKAQAQHDAIAQAYREAGVTVHYIEPAANPSPNLMFAADLMFMTPEGAILARPASTVRAGEERQVARRLADLGVPILCSIGGRGTFEGADAMWLNPQTVILGRGLRTNDDGVGQVTAVLNSIGVQVITVDMPVGTMHLMGMLRIVAGDLAIGWPYRLAHRAHDALRAHGCQVAFIPDETEAEQGMALNFVTLGPRHILMPAGNPKTQAFYESLDITCHTVAVNELSK
ncbi:MAG: dimethylarginine dimethylaminohydrolase family protein, partial [Anaerolineae bacterium]